MKISHISIFPAWKDKNKYSSSAHIKIPGFDELTVNDCISRETIEKICTEIEQYTRLKLNIIK